MQLQIHICPMGICSRQRVYLVTGYTYEAGIACVLYGKQGACKTTKTNKRSYPYITQKGEYRECDPCQYIANIKGKTVTGYKYLDLSDAAGIIASVSGRARGKLRLFTQIDGDCIGEIDIHPNTRRAKTGIRFSLAESALYFSFEGSGKLNLLNFTVTTSKEDNS